MNSSPRHQSGLDDQDLELLSAYIDQQLTAAERVNVERRLGAEPALQRELDELRATAAALRALPPLAPPRSFGLDPATAARPRRFLPLSWFMQLGSGLAGLALVLLATVQFLAAGMGGGAPAAMPASAPAAEMAPMSADEMRAAATEAPAAMSAPAAEATAAPAAEALPAATTAPAAPAASAAGGDAGTTGGAAGGVAGGPASNSPMAQSAPAGGTAPASDAVQSSGSSAADTQAPAIEAAPKQPDAATAGEPAGGAAGAPVATLPLGPGLTLALGVALLALAVGVNLASRRGA